MILTLAVSSLRRQLSPSSGGLRLSDVPSVASGELGLRGLALETSLLSGVELGMVDSLRDAADKSGCPCLFLIEDQVHPLGDMNESLAAASLERINRVLRVGHRLGCSSVAVTLASPASSASEEEAEEYLDTVAARLKVVVGSAERLELNVLIEPEPGLTVPADHVTTLIRKVGGFRIGSLPDFASATEHEDAVKYLRSVVPYASAVGVPTSHLPVDGGGGESWGSGGPGAYDLEASVNGIKAVGYDAAMTIRHRGTSEPKAAVVATRQAVEMLLEGE